MTRDEFDSQYRVLKKTGSGPARTSMAEHRASGRVVQVHFFDGGLDGPGIALLGLLERLTPADRTRVLEAVGVDESVVFVTQPLPEGQDFEQWLRGAAGGAGSHAPGEFTALFQAAPEPPAKPASSEPKPAPPAAGPSFTEMFRAPSAPSPKPAPGSEASTAPPVRVVGVRLPTPPAAPIEPRGPPIPAPRLGGDAAPPAAAPPPPELPVPRPAALYVPEPPAAPPRPAPWAGPSDFTRQLSPGTPFSEQVPVIPPATPPEVPGRKASHLPLFIALNLIFIIVTGLVVYFALRRC